jgi:hypothetical protein
VQGESNAIANCFISGYSIVENIDNIIYIFNNAGEDSGAYKWFEWVLEEPVNLALNSTVLYQMCSLSEYIVMFKSWFDVDFAAYSYDLVSMTVNGVLDIPDDIAAWNALQCDGTCSCPDPATGAIPVVDPEDCDAAVNKYGQGQIIGKAVSRFFGQFVPPVVA